VHHLLNFSGLSEVAGPVKLNFNSNMFDWMRKQWESIGASDQYARVMHLNRLSAVRLADLAHHALHAGAPSDNDEYGNAWGIYQSNTSSWRFGAANRYFLTADQIAQRTTSMPN
jgi:hypothetical protein